jgi:hypothetical protein
MDDEPYQLIFAPGCFDNFDGTQEELDEMIADIKRMVEDGTIFDEMVPLLENEIKDLGLENFDPREVVVMKDLEAKRMKRMN